MRVLRSVLIFKVGVWTGMMAAAALAKRALPSRGDEDSEELSLVAIFHGVDLKSRARAFRGGSIFAWYGGVALDLRETELAGPARLSVNTLMGGIEIKTPPSWRVESNVKTIAGGVEARGGTDDEAAPVLTLDGTALFGGISVGPGSDAGPSTT